jgi:hypothetical protein
MVIEGIVFGHKVSGKGIGLDDSRTVSLKILPMPHDVKGVRNFSGHVGFYRRFIKDFTKIVSPLNNLLQKIYIIFSIDDDCILVFDNIKEARMSAPIIQSPKWDESFEVMCEASDYVIGAVLGQHEGINLNVIHYASHMLDEDQKNYATTEK